MADKVDKPKKQKAKPKHDEKGVLAALPSTRPERIGGRRSAAPKPKRATAGSNTAAPAKQPAAPKVAAAKASSAAKTSPRAAKPASAARRKPASARNATTAARRKAAAPRTFEPTEAAETAAGAADERATARIEPPPPPRDPATSFPRPRPVREGAPGIGTIGHREQPSSESGRPNGIELVTTAVQAAGELAQIGLTIGGQILKRAAKRLPKP